MELEERLRRFRVFRKEFLVNLLTLVLLAAIEQVVGYLDACGPILLAVAVRERGNLLFRLVELV